MISKFDEKLLKRLEVLECSTCESRVYQDGSNDPGVSFKTPTHISPEMSGPMVAAHENEHVVREGAKAESEGREVISQSVRLFNGICPECGKSYVSGGVTETTTAKKAEKNTRVRIHWQSGGYEVIIENYRNDKVRKKNGFQIY